MDDSALTCIYNYLRLDEWLATAGQPLEDELSTIATAGFDIVINLALENADYSLPDERGSVTALGLDYVPIPVIWEQPCSDKLETFFQTMEQYRGKKIFLHCAANKRVSCFVALYRCVILSWPIEQAMVDVCKIWKPNAIWQRFMADELSRYRHA